MSDPDPKEVARAKKLLQLRGTGDLHRRVAVERKIKQLPDHVHAAAKGRAAPNGAADHKAAAPAKKPSPTKKPGVVEIDAGTVGVGMYQLEPDQSPTEKIHLLVEDWYKWEALNWENYRAGVEQFYKTLTNGEDLSAPAHEMSEVFKGVAEILIIHAFPEGEAMKTAAEAVAKVTIGAVADLDKGARDQMAEGGKAKIADFVNGVYDVIAKNAKKNLEDLIGGKGDTGQRGALVKAYWALSPGDDSPHPAANGVVFGPFGRFLKGLEQWVDTRHAAVQEPRFFEEQLAERFSQTKEWSAPISRGGRESGRLYIEATVHKADDGTWYWYDQPDHWTLASPDKENRGRLASSLVESLKGQGKRLVDCDLEKVVELKAYHGGRRHGSVLGATQYEGRFSFYSPESYKVESAEDSLVAEAFKTFLPDLAAIEELRGGE